MGEKSSVGTKTENKKLFNQEQQDAISKTCGVSVLFIAIAGAMEGMLKIEGTKISSGKSMLVVLCLVRSRMCVQDIRLRSDI